MILIARPVARGPVPIPQTTDVSYLDEHANGKRPAATLSQEADMSEILLRAEDARAGAQDVVKSAEAAQQDFDSLKTRLGALADSFRGESAKAFDEKYEEWSTSAKELMAALDGLGQFLTQAADTIEQTDTQIAASLRG